MKKTGIFSGSFNPIHIGHLALANWLCAYEELDEIWFLVTPHSPLKKKEELMDDEKRLQLARLAVSDYPKFKVSDFEFSLPQPTYTYDTLQALEQVYPDHSFCFIMGADNWEIFHKWKNYTLLLEQYPILIYPRKGYPIIIPDKYNNVKAVDAPEMEISSTFIRKAIADGKDVRFFLPEAIRSFFPFP